MKNSQKGSVTIILVIIALIVVGVGVYVTYPTIDWERLDNVAQTDIQCKNSEYATVRNSYQEGFITLTSDSEQKLLKEIRERGDIVLHDISTLHCLEYLYFAPAAEITNLSALSSLSNLKELTFSGIKVKDLSPLANLNNLERLKITSLNVFDDISPLLNLKSLKELSLGVTQAQCNKLKQALPNTSIACRLR